MAPIKNLSVIVDIVYYRQFSELLKRLTDTRKKKFTELENHENMRNCMHLSFLVTQAVFWPCASS